MMRTAKRMTGLVLVLMMVFMPSMAFSQPSQASDCFGCHVDSTTLTVHSSVTSPPLHTWAIYHNGSSYTGNPASVTVAPGDSFEVDWIGDNMNNGGGAIAKNTAVRKVISVPAGWTVGAPAVNHDPIPAGWNTVWNNHPWNDGVTNTNIDFSATWAATPQGHYVVYDGTGWLSGSAPGAAFDDGSAGDLDTVADKMGADVEITVPGGTAAATYQIKVLTVGHLPSGTNKNATNSKATFIIPIDVIVSSGGGDVTAPVPNNDVAVSVESGTHVPAAFDVTATFAEPEGGVTGCEYTLNNGGAWSAGTVSGAGPYTCTANVTGQTNGSTLDISMRMTSAGGTSAASTYYPTRTVDTVGPVQGTAPALTATTGAAGEVNLSWSVATDAGSGLEAVTTYRIRQLPGTTPPNADCTSDGTEIYASTGTSTTDTGLTNGADYAYRLCTYDALGHLTSGQTSTAAAGSVANANPNDPTNLAQLLLDGVTPIAVGGYTTEASVVFEADLSDPDGGDTVKLQIDTDSNGTFDCESVLVAQQVDYQLTCPLADGAVNWQARTVDNLGAASNWVPFNAANPDFTKDASAPVDGTLTATSGDGQIVLTWTAASDAHSGLASPAYTVSMATGTTTPPADCSTNVIYTGDALTHTETPLTNGVDYAFRLCADNNAGLTSAGSTDTTQPAAGCVYTDPTVNILTASKEITVDGGFAEYAVQVTNNDSVACGNTTFNLSVSDNNGTNFYTSALELTSLNIAPGASDQTTFRVSAQPNQPNASTDISDVTSAADANHGAVTSGTVTTTINVAGGGCLAAGDYLNTNGDQLLTERR